MINLIPLEKKKKLIRTFFIRFLTAIVFAIAFGGLVATINISPAYFSANIKLSVAEEDFTAQEKDVLSPAEAEASAKLSGLDKQSEIIANHSDDFLVSERVIDEILSKKTRDIKINKITYVGEPSGDKEVYIKGKADSRESLLDFKITLERDPSWKEVDLPVSNFVSGSDISFSLTLIPVK